MFIVYCQQTTSLNIIQPEINDVFREFRLAVQKKILFFLITFVATAKSVIKFVNPNSTLTLNGTTAQLILQTPINNIDGILKITDKTSTSITQSSPANVLTFSVSGTSFFNSTSYNPNGASLNITGTSSGISLSGNQSFSTSGTIPDTVSVSGTGNTLYGNIQFQRPIIMASSTTALTIGLDTKLTASINLAGGTLSLSKDLILKDNVYLYGGGTINFNGFSLQLPGFMSSAITGNLTFVAANDVTVNTRTNLTGTWNFTGSGLSSCLIGRGNILDLSRGGVINVGTNHTLFINSLHIKGLGAGGPGNITMAASTSKIYLSNCILDLKGTYTLTQGLMVFEGGMCKVITHTAERFVVSGATTEMRVDGTVLVYESLDKMPEYPFSITSSGTIRRVNGGEIRSDWIPSSGGETFIQQTAAQGANFTNTNIVLTSDSKIRFVNSTPATAKSMIFDGNNNTIFFQNGEDRPMTIDQNTTVTFQNVIFDNFDISKIFIGAGSSIIFGDGVVIRVAKNLNQSTTFWNITGNTTIVGDGSSLLTVGSQMIRLSGTNKSLTLQNLKMKWNSFDSVKVNTSTGTVNMQDCEFIMTNAGITFDLGDLNVSGRSTITGSDSITTSTTTSNFSLTTPGILTIQTNGTLIINKGTTFTYEPNTEKDGSIVSVMKRHLKMQDPSARLILDSCTISTGAKGLALDFGNLVIDGHTSFNISSNRSAEFEIGTALNVEISPSAVFLINGPMIYTETPNLKFETF